MNTTNDNTFEENGDNDIHHDDNNAPTKNMNGTPSSLSPTTNENGSATCIHNNLDYNYNDNNERPSLSQEETLLHEYQTLAQELIAIQKKRLLIQCQSDKLYSSSSNTTTRSTITTRNHPSGSCHTHTNNINNTSSSSYSQQILYQYNQARYNHSLALSNYKSIQKEMQNLSQQLERIQNCHPLSDCFYIWHRGPFATINGLRIGIEAFNIMEQQEQDTTISAVGQQSQPLSFTPPRLLMNDGDRDKISDSFLNKNQHFDKIYNGQDNATMNHNNDNNNTPSRKQTQYSTISMPYSTPIRSNDKSNITNITKNQTIKVSWSEMNAALGSITLLLSTLPNYQFYCNNNNHDNNNNNNNNTKTTNDYNIHHNRKSEMQYYNIHYTQFKLLPMGSFSKIQTLFTTKYHSSNQMYDLYYNSYNNNDDNETDITSLSQPSSSSRQISSSSTSSTGTTSITNTNIATSSASNGATTNLLSSISSFFVHSQFLLQQQQTLKKFNYAVMALTYCLYEACSQVLKMDSSLVLPYEIDVGLLKDSSIQASTSTSKMTSSSSTGLSFLGFFGGGGGSSSSSSTAIENNDVKLDVTIGGLSVCYNGDGILWTKCMRYLAVDLKWLLASLTRHGIVE